MNVNTIGLCRAIPAKWEAGDVPTRRAAISECNHCPALRECLRLTMDEATTNEQPVGVVQAGIAFDDNGLVDPAVHGAHTATELAAAIGVSGPAQHDTAIQRILALVG